MAKPLVIEKLIVTSRQAMIKKYEKPGWNKILRSVREMIEADKKRGITSAIVFLDDSRAMKKAKGKAVNDAADMRASKEAVDALYRYYQPDYLLLLGAPDVIPHILLDNPIAKISDDDFKIPSDLPYACASKYSKNIRQYLSPTRVVSRLPDIKGGSDPEQFIRIIHHAIRQHPRPQKDYDNYLAISAGTWKGSTSLSLQRIFGNDSKMIVVPPSTISRKKYSELQLSRRVHFINCHGASGSPYFYGENPHNHNDQPYAFSSFQAGDYLPHGSIVAAECCYGAQLFDPTHELDPQWLDEKIPYHLMPICMQYMLAGAAAYLGSTTTAYGDSHTQSNADLMTQYFLRAVRRGASTGRAFLETRHRFIETSAPRLDPVELKTYAQFILLGDPSVHPVEMTRESFEEEIAGLTELYLAAKLSQRRSRREMLSAKGALLEQIAEAPELRQKIKLSPKQKKEFAKVLRKFKMTDAPSTSFGFRHRKAVDGLEQRNMQYHLYAKKEKSSNPKRPSSTRIVVVKTANGKMTEVKTYISKG